MAPRQRRALKDKDILDCLEDFEIEDDADDMDFQTDGTDDEYVPNNRVDSQGSSSDSSSESEKDEPLPLQQLRGRGRIRAVRGESRGRSSRAVSIHGRGSRRRGSRGRTSRRRSSCGRGSATIHNTLDEDDSTLNSVNHEWLQKSFAPPIGNLSEPSYLPIDSSEFTDEQYFQQYIDDDLVSVIVEKSNQMHVFRTGKSLDLNIMECKIYIAVTMLMSCINYPYIRMYWESKWRIPRIADAMPRNRYFQLRTSLKLVFDPEITQNEKSRDKLWKVRPLIDRLLQGCHKQERAQHISIDEMIIPFAGSCGIKQYCPNKPNPVGLKAFVLANPDGIVCDLKIYQGETTFVEENAAGFGLGDSAVLHLTRTLVPGHVLYFDRYFTSLKLVNELSIRGFKSAGTVMRNRIPSSLKSQLPDDREMKKEGRGYTSVFVNSDDNVAFTKWFDNKPVLLMSTAYGSEPFDECRRWSKKDKQYIHIQRPMVVKMYNSKMGGVDLADRMLAVCPSRARTNKWTIRFLSHMIDLAVSNAWIKFRKTETEKGLPVKKIISLRQWKMRLAEEMIDLNIFGQYVEREESEEEHEPPSKRGRPSTIPLPSKTQRQFGLHLPVFEGIPNRCRLQGCSQRTTAKCSICDVALCLTAKRNCYMQFHLN